MKKPKGTKKYSEYNSEDRAKIVQLNNLKHHYRLHKFGDPIELIATNDKYKEIFISLVKKYGYPNCSGIIIRLRDIVPNYDTIKDFLEDHPEEIEYWNADLRAKPIRSRFNELDKYLYITFDKDDGYGRCEYRPGAEDFDEPKALAFVKESIRFNLNLSSFRDLDYDKPIYQEFLKTICNDDSIDINSQEFINWMDEYLYDWGWEGAAWIDPETLEIKSFNVDYD